MRLLYLVFFKTILAALFRTFGLPLRFLSSKPSFLDDRFPAQHLDFSSLSAVSSTEKPVNRNMHAYALARLNVFALKGFIFHNNIHKKKQGRSSRNTGYKDKKSLVGNTLAHAHLWSGCTQIEY